MSNEDQPMSTHESNMEAIASTLQQILGQVAGLAERVEHVEHATRAAAQQCHQEAVIAASAPPPTPAAATTSHDSSGSWLKVNKPPEFDGKDKKSATTFLAHLQLCFQANSNQFRTDRDKVVFAASYLRGQAFAWFEPHLLDSKSALVTSWDNFETAFLQAHGDTDRERTLTRELQSLTQTGSASSYATKFFQISAFLTWNDSALQAQFYTGLKPEVKDALALIDKQTHDSVLDLSTQAIKLDNRLHERRVENKKGTSAFLVAASRTSSSPATPLSTPRQAAPSSSSAPQSSSSHNGPAPMDLDATRPRFLPLTPEEKARRVREGLCLYCGGQGHNAQQCPKKSSNNRSSGQKPLQAAEVSFTVVGPQSGEAKNDSAQASLGAQA
jgi:hypothetical protein